MSLTIELKPTRTLRVTLRPTNGGELLLLSAPSATLKAQVAAFVVAQGGGGGAFMVANRFFEIAADETAKQAARDNLGVSVIDGGTFF